MDSIAIVGYSFKLPGGSEDDTNFWDMLANARNVMTPWPKTRVNVDAFYDAKSKRTNTLQARGAHFVKEDPGAFDAPFFSISSKEAGSMDPQQRWLLEESYRALENAGMPLERVAGSDTSVFVASMADDYMRMVTKDPDEAPTNTATGTSPSILANRLSWYFDFKGPSLQLNTACSSSMIAMDLACQSLRNGQCSMALVGGANVILNHESSLYLSNMGFLSPDSLCYSFDSRANGYSRGEGVVVLVLKKLPDAIRDGDVIRAVIRATGSNQDGYTPGLTQPSASSQEMLIRQVYERNNLSFESTRYVEAHGTGTQIGDATETTAIGKVFRRYRSAQEPLYVGSIKANVGHLEGGSGLAGIMKSIMILERGLIPPNALFKQLNPKINSRLYHIKVPTAVTPWPGKGLRRISINSFGFGGSNGHIVLDDAYHTLAELGLKGNHRTLITSSDGISSLVVNGTSSAEATLNGEQETNGLSGEHTEATNGTTVTKDSMVASPDDVARVNSPRTNGTVSHHREGLENGDKNHSNLPNGQASDVNGSNHAVNGVGVNGHGHAVTANGVNGHSSDDNIDSNMAAKPKVDAFKNHVNGATQPKQSKLKLLVWSAKDEAGLKRVLKQYATYAETHIAGSKENLDRLAYTLAARRSVLSWRSFAVVDSRNSPATVINGSATNAVRSSRQGAIAFVFTGQGAQYAKMGLDLLQYPVFKATLHNVNQIFLSLGAEWSLFDKLQDQDNINKPQFSQPLSTALQLALVELLGSFGITPAAVVGHSSGEIAAAYCAGALSLESACKVAYHRGRLAGNLVANASVQGAMMSVNLREEEVEDYLTRVPLNSRVHVACVNSPSNVTLSGNSDDIDILKKYLDEDGTFAHKVNTGVAYHSPAMEELASDYLTSMGQLEQGDARRKKILLVSSVTGNRASGQAMANGQYWVDNMVSPVRFSDALHYLATVAPKADGLKPLTDFVEVGPHGALKRAVSDTLTASIHQKTWKYDSVLSRLEAPVKSLLSSVGRLFSQGHPVSILAVNQQETLNHAIPFLSDTPAYPFDHSQNYWAESRMSRNWRLREAVPGCLLGMRVNDWNPLEPRWRKTLSVEEFPWIADHIVGDNMYFPATGTLAMALEAVKQAEEGLKTITGYRIKDAVLKNPIIVPAEGKADVIIQLHRIQHAHAKSSPRSEVRIFTCNDDFWNEAFKATIYAEYEEPATEVDGGKEVRLTAERLLGEYNHARAVCKDSLSSQEFYAWHKQQGLSYGESFALAQDLHWDGADLGVATVNVGPPAEPFDGLFHPAVLDASCQICFMGPAEGMSKSLPTIIPHKISNAWVSASGWQYPDTTCIKTATKSRFKSTSSGIDSEFIVVADSGKLLCHVGHLEMLPAQANVSDGVVRERNLIHGLDWKPRLSLLSPEQLQNYCDVNSFPDDETVAANYNIRLKKALLAIMRQNIDELRKTDWTTAPSHMKKFTAWIERELSKNPVDEAENALTGVVLLKELNALRHLRPAARMFIEIAQDLVSIIQGKTDIIALLFSTPLAQDLYDMLFERMGKLESYVQLLSHQDPNQKILEVGSGTGGLTSILLSYLQNIENRTGGVAFSEYVYTDISTGFFEKARERFAEHQDRMTFKAFDLEKESTSQGFLANGYDVIFAGSVLHATKNLNNTLQNLRKLLKPGGKLVFHETTAEDSFIISFGFGPISGWWLSEEEFRTWTPTITVPEWDRVLRENGFTGNDVVIKDYKDKDAHWASFIISTVDETPKIKSEDSSRVLMVVDEASNYQKTVASTLLTLLSNQHVMKAESLTLEKLNETELSSADYICFLTEMEQPQLANLTEASFKSLQNVISLTKNLIWVTSTLSPFTGLKDGFFRTIRSENQDKRLVTLSLDDQQEHSAAEMIAKVFTAAFTDASIDDEYVVKDGRILTPRLIQQIEFNQDMKSSIVPQPKSEPWLPGPPLKVDINTRGQIETLQYVEDSTYYEPLGAEEVEVEAKSWGINFRDVFLALGRLDETGFGSDCAGIVTRVGSACTSVKPGDRVVMGVVGCMRMYPRGDENAVCKIPDSISFEEACGILNSGITAWHSLVNVARIRKGDKILIHAASGTTGQLAVQIAQMHGAEVFATVGYNHKKKLLIEEYGIPEDHIFYSRDTSFAQGLLRVTNGYGVDIVLNSLVGEGLLASWECVAPHGRFIEIGKADINANSSLPMAFFAKNVSFSGVDLRYVALHDKELGRGLLLKVMELAGEGAIYCPKPLHVYGLDNLQDGFRYLQSGKNMGRIVVKIDSKVTIEKHLLNKRDWSLREDATYLVAGGLGGLGRSMLMWLASKGAKNLLVPSRSGASSQAAAEVLETLRAGGVNVQTPKCDVSSAESLAAVLEECRSTLPPVRGCINAAMVLQDSVFENMAHTQWQRTLQSKVDSTKNLDDHLGDGLDFFISLASAAGIIGNISQSNYAAGCTFQDAVARHRVDRGQKAISIDLGLMRTIGIVAESETLHKNFEGSKSLAQIEENEFLDVLDICCRPEGPCFGGEVKSQISVGLITPADLLATGMEPEEMLNRPLFAYFSRLRGISSGSSDSANAVNFGALFRATESAEERSAVATEALATKLARSLSMQVQDIDTDQPIYSYGVDSLVAVEIRNWISKEFAANVPVFEITGGKSVAAIGEFITRTSQFKKGQ